jgi:multimeric flavodoxin WrbA
MKVLECSQEDDFAKMIPILSASDLAGLVVATPVYFGSMTSQSIHNGFMDDNYVVCYFFFHIFYFQDISAVITLFFYLNDLLKTKWYIAQILFRRVINIDSCSTLST